MNIDIIRKDLEKLHKKYVRKYDATKQHFNVGDKAWAYSNNGELIEVVIEEIESFKREENDGGCIYYYFRIKNISKAELIKEYIIFYIWYIRNFRNFGLKNLKYVPKPGTYGRSEMVGRNEVLFKDKTECYMDHIINHIYDELDELEGLIGEEYKNDV